MCWFCDVRSAQLREALASRADAVTPSTDAQVDTVAERHVTAPPLEHKAAVVPSHACDGIPDRCPKQMAPGGFGLPSSNTSRSDGRPRCHPHTK